MQQLAELIDEVDSLVQAAAAERELRYRMLLAYHDCLTRKPVAPVIRQWYSTLSYDWKLPSLRSGHSIEVRNTGTDPGYGPIPGTDSVLEMRTNLIDPATSPKVSPEEFARPPAAYVRLGAAPSLRRG